MKRLLISMIAVILFLVACAGTIPAPDPTYSPYPTYTPYPSPTSIPTSVAVQVCPLNQINALGFRMSSNLANIPVLASPGGEFGIKFLGYDRSQALPSGGEGGVETYVIECGDLMLCMSLGVKIGNQIAQELAQRYEEIMPDCGWAPVDCELIDQEEYNYIHGTSLKEWVQEWEGESGYVYINIIPRPAQVILVLALEP